MSASLHLGVIGYGYWGPNLVRNFAAGPRTKVVAIAEQNPNRRQAAEDLMWALLNTPEFIFKD